MKSASAEAEPAAVRTAPTRKAKYALVAAIVTGGVIAFLYWRFGGATAAANSLLVSGNIEAHQSLVSFKDVESRIVELPFDEGQWVEQGTVLARVDDSNYRQQVAVDEAALRVQQAQLESVRQNLQATEQTIMNDRADLAQKKVDDQRYQVLWREGATSAQSRDLADTATKQSEAALRRDAALERVAEKNIATAQANIKDAFETLRLANVMLGYTVLRAPFTGVILVRQTELGEVMQPGTPVVTLADLDHVWMRAYVSETDLGRIQWGQPATITTDTYPGKKYPGRISFISSSAEFTPKSVETHEERVTLVYRIKIDVENPNHELKPGMPADALIQLRRANADGNFDGQPIVRH